MSILTTPSRILNTALQQMGRHGWHTVAAFAVMTLTFFVITLFALVAMGSNVVLNFFENQPQMIVFLTDEATEDRVSEIRTALEATGKVETIHYSSKEEALAFYKEQTKDTPALTENLSANILPASLEVSPKELRDIDSLAGVVSDPVYESFIESVSYPKDLTDRLSSWTSTGRLVGVALIVFLVLVSFLIMLVTIGMNIASYREEISVMRLVGASNWYIRGPFMLEGVLYAVGSAVMAVLVVYLALPWVAPKLESWFTGIQIFPIPVLQVFGGLLLAEILIGILLALLGSAVARRRSLKV